jgi:hypothetical protein
LELGKAGGGKPPFLTCSISMFEVDLSSLIFEVVSKKTLRLAQRIEHRSEATKLGNKILE